MSVASFYLEHDFGGTSHDWGAPSDVTFYSGDEYNDKFLSLIVGPNLKVQCHQHSDGSGRYIEYKEGRYPNMGDDIGGLSQFQVLQDSTTFGIGIALKSNIENSQPGDYSLDLKAYEIGEVLVLSDEERKVLPSTSVENEITCSLYIRDTHSYVYVATGSVYFKWDPESGIVDLVEADSAIPSNVSYVRDSATSFTFTLEYLEE